MTNLIDLTDRKILVVGASSGIGKQTAITLSKVGATVILVSRREDKLRETLSLLEGEGHGIHCFDTQKLDEIEEHIKQIISEYGPLDGMVYCAGVGTAIPLLQTKPEKIQNVFEVNFFGFLETVRQLCRKGRFNPGMRIVGISSCASLRGDKSKTAYSASKAAMDSAIRCIAREMADRGICINSIAPSMTATELYGHYLEKYGEDSETNLELLKRQYLGIAETSDIANAVAFLISPAAKFITGITLPVDGGLTTC